MGHQHHRPPLVGQLLNHLQHLANQFRIQGRGRLVEEHQFRLLRQRPGDRHPLLLTARKALGKLIRLVRHMHLGEHRIGELVGLRLAHPADFHGRDGGVVPGVQVRPKIETLKHHAHMGALLGEFFLGHVNKTVAHLLFAEQLAVQVDVTAGGRFHVVDAAKHGGLTASARPNDRRLMAPFEGRANALQHVEAAKALVQILHPKQKFRHEAPPARH